MEVPTPRSQGSTCRAIISAEPVSRWSSKLNFEARCLPYTSDCHRRPHPRRLNNTRKLGRRSPWPLSSRAEARGLVGYVDGVHAVALGKPQAELPRARPLSEDHVPPVVRHLELLELRRGERAGPVRAERGSVAERAPAFHGQASRGAGAPSHRRRRRRRRHHTGPGIDAVCVGQANMRAAPGR
jgi:hypothetical protein